MQTTSSQRLLSRLRGESGQSLVEFAFAVPLLLLVVLALVDFGRAVNYWLDATHVASEGARLAAVNGSRFDCTTLATRIKDETYGELLTGSSGGAGVQSPATVTISFPQGGTPQVGDPVKVTVSAVYGYVPGGFIPGSFDIVGSSTMRLEQAPPSTFPAGGCSA